MMSTWFADALTAPTPATMASTATMTATTAMATSATSASCPDSPTTRPNTGTAMWRHAAAALEASLSLYPNIAAAIHAPTPKDGPVRATLRPTLSSHTGSSVLRDGLRRALGHF